MASIGHPILGDKLYGEEGNILCGKGLFLASVELAFMHPVLETSMNIIIEEPDKFKSTLIREKNRWEKFKT